MTDEEYRPIAAKLTMAESVASRKILTALLSSFDEADGALIDTKDWNDAAQGMVRIEGTVDNETFEVTLAIVDIELTPLYRDDFDEPEED